MNHNKKTDETQGNLFDQNPTYRDILLTRKVLPTSKALKLYTSLSSTLTTSVLLQHSNGRWTLQQSFEMFQRNVNKLTLNLKCTKFMHSQQMTLHDMVPQ